MTEPTEETRGMRPGRLRALLVVVVGLVVCAALVVFLSAESPSGETETVQATEPPGASPTTGAPTEQGGEQPTSTPPTTATQEVSAATTTPSADSSEDSPTTTAEATAEVDIEADLQAVLDSLTTGLDIEAVGRLSKSGDLRLAWVFADLMRFINPDILRFAFIDLTGVEIATGLEAWRDANNKLIQWDTPAPPGFREWKGQMYTLIQPGWAPFFEDQNSLIDWRHVTWGGVGIDDRPLDAVHLPCPRGCIPALNDPRLVPASQGGYYPDDAYVFAVTVNGEAVAFPKNMMEIHEMVNITIGGRRLGIPYCTLCGSAQAYFTDVVPDSVRDRLGDAETFELRTSGLLTRSNKVMYEFHTRSVFDTFTGQAVSGPLREAGVWLPQTTVVASRWGDWKQANPHTLIVAQDGGIGRSYPEDPLRGRDDHGPIFPIGDWDERLPVQEKVLGVLFERGAEPSAVAFPVVETHAALQRGEVVEHAGIVVSRDGGGLRAWGPDGAEIPAHEAFWFAWSQFHPGTALWRPAAG